MKIKILFIVLLVSVLSIAQEASNHIGTWSFKELDTSMSDGKDEDEINFMNNMFSSMKFEFINESTFQIKILGDIEEYQYTKSGDTLNLPKGGKFILMDNNLARMQSKDTNIIFQFGDVQVVKKYSILTQDNYKLKPVNSELLIGKWEVQEARAASDDEEGAIVEMLAKMVAFEFISDKKIAVGLSGMQSVKDYRIEKDSQDIVFVGDDGYETRVYTLIELTEEYMIVRHIKEGTYLYLTKK